MQNIHASQCAKRHTYLQVPNDTLPDMPIGILYSGMADDFRKAFLWHLKTHETSFADLVRDTGVSRDVLNKLKARDDASTSVENGMLIAAFYGKTINEFLAREESTSVSRVRALLDLLSEEERQLLELQIRGVLRPRESV